MPEAPGGVDLAALAAWMDERGLPSGPIELVAPVRGGTQNVMLRLRRGGRDFVLRRGPRHLRPKSNDAIRREIAVLRALGQTEVRCPRIIASCEDAAVLGVVLYLMEPIDGFNPTLTLPAPHAGDDRVRHSMGIGAANALSKLHGVDHAEVGLDGLGRPDGFLERQVPRWLSELESYSSFDGYPGSLLPGIDATAVWLEAHRPSSFTPGIVHGDYHLANLMFTRDGPEVAAIVDWEMCTIGDPLLDLGWLLATWPDGGENPAGGAIGAAGGLPSRSELIAAYASRSTRDLSAIHWYTVLACFKLGIVLEGTHARASAGMASAETGDRLHSLAVGLLERAQTTIGAR